MKYVPCVVDRTEGHGRSCTVVVDNGDDYQWLNGCRRFVISTGNMILPKGLRVTAEFNLASDGTVTPLVAKEKFEEPITIAMSSEDMKRHRKPYTPYPDHTSDERFVAEMDDYDMQKDIATSIKRHYQRCEKPLYSATARDAALDTEFKAGKDMVRYSTDFELGAMADKAPSLAHAGSGRGDDVENLVELRYECDMTGCKNEHTVFARHDLYVSWPTVCPTTRRFLEINDLRVVHARGSRKLNMCYQCFESHFDQICPTRSCNYKKNGWAKLCKASQKTAQPLLSEGDFTTNAGLKKYAMDHWLEMASDAERALTGGAQKKHIGELITRLTDAVKREEPGFARSSESGLVAKVIAARKMLSQEQASALAASKDWCVTILGRPAEPGHVCLYYWDKEKRILNVDARKWFKFKKMGKTTGWVNPVTGRIWAMDDGCMLLVYRYGLAHDQIRLIPCEKPKGRNDSMLNILKALSSTIYDVQINNPNIPLSNAEVMDHIMKVIDREVRGGHTQFIDIGGKNLTKVMRVVNPYEIHQYNYPEMENCTDSTNLSMSDADIGTQQAVYDLNGYDESYWDRPLTQDDLEKLLGLIVECMTVYEAEALEHKVDVGKGSTRRLARETAYAIRTRTNDNILEEVKGHIASRAA